MGMKTTEKKERILGEPDHFIEKGAERLWVDLFFRSRGLRLPIPWETRCEDGSGKISFDEFEEYASKRNS